MQTTRRVAIGRGIFAVYLVVDLPSQNSRAIKIAWNRKKTVVGPYVASKQLILSQSESASGWNDTQVLQYSVCETRKRNIANFTKISPHNRNKLFVCFTYSHSWNIPDARNVAKIATYLGAYRLTGRKTPRFKVLWTAWFHRRLQKSENDMDPDNGSIHISSNCRPVMRMVMSCKP